MHEATPMPGATYPTLYPCRDDVAVGSERAAPRLTLLIRTAKVIGRSGEWLSIIRDASPEGLRLKTFHPIPPDPEFELELSNGQRHKIIKVWERGDLAGFRFDRPVDIERLATDAPAHLRKREIRLNCLIPLVVSARQGECDARFHDISQHGARLECGLHLAVGERIRLDSEVLPPIVGTVRWRRMPFYGVSFDRVFAFDELARLCGVVPPLATAAAALPATA